MKRKRSGKRVFSSNETGTNPAICSAESRAPRSYSGDTGVPAGPFLVHGAQAEIKRGTLFIAAVDQDTPLPAVK